MLKFRPRKTTTRIIVSGGHEDIPDADPVPLLRVRGREMGLLEIGYHAVVSAKGDVWQCRRLDLMGSHTPGHNHDSVGVYLAGTALGPGQIETLRLIRTDLADHYGPLPVLGKSEVIRYRNKPTGPFFDMDELRAKLGITR